MVFRLFDTLTASSQNSVSYKRQLSNPIAGIARILSRRALEMTPSTTWT